MDIEFIRNYCLKKKGSSEDFPFDEETLVFKVSGKLFLLTNIYSSPLSVNLKCEPEQAIDWREQYECVQPGYHMNKKHWNTVTFCDEITQKQFLEMIDHSYQQVVLSLPKKVRDAL